MKRFLRLVSTAVLAFVAHTGYAQTLPGTPPDTAKLTTSERTEAYLKAEQTTVTVPSSKVVRTTATGSRSASASRTYQTGPRGGCFYYSASGKKVYVDHSYCR